MTTRQFRVGIVITALLLSNLALANSSDCEMKTRKVRFNIASVETLDGMKLVGDENELGGTLLEGPYTQRILKGSITVFKQCQTPTGLHLTQASVPATARLTLIGANARAGSLGAIPINTGFYIHNFQGKNLQEAVLMPFYGAKLAATVGLALAANPNAALLMSKSKMFITDFESLVGIGPALALGVTASYARLNLYVDFSNVSDSDAELFGKTL